ncbi:uncharacterized protein LOC133529827 [Cydia pomonella]|uniref:uncharacterized protein LOC133529827 n=1 Tax=Cydia pomonella TaxID=82600 RepID=UPI002ADDFFD0|nr:uncharacterized protein LOC133529827 [Cydia pomonella]
MGKPKCDPPTPTFPYKISKRLNVMSIPRPWFTVSDDGMPAYTPRGIRASALRGRGSERVNEAAWPYLRRLLLTKRMYKHMFSADRLERIDRMIEMANSTAYSKLAGCVIDLKTKDKKDPKKKKGWSETEWKKHMDYISQIANPRKDFTVEVPRRGERRKLEQLLPRINIIAMLPEFKIYRRPSQESNYRDPTKVAPNALKYVISDRVKKLAKPREIPTGE